MTKNDDDKIVTVEEDNVILSTEIYAKARGEIKRVRPLSELKATAQKQLDLWRLVKDAAREGEDVRR